MVFAENECTTILCKSNHVIGEYSSGEGLEFLRGAEQPSRCFKIIQSDYSYQRVNTAPLGVCTPTPPAVYTARSAETFMTQVALLVNTVMTVKTLLQRSLSITHQRNHHLYTCTKDMFFSSFILMTTLSKLIKQRLFPINEK